MKIKYLSAIIASLMCTVILCIGAYADEPDIIPKITEKTTEQSVEETVTTTPAISEEEAKSITTVSTNIVNVPEVTEIITSEEYLVRTYFDGDTHQPVYGWISYLENKYYNDREQGKLTGMQDIDDNTYIFMDTGIMQTGFGKYQGYMYYCDESGILIKGDDKYTPINIGGINYIISPSGKVHTGWQTVNKNKYYSAENGKMALGLFSINGNKYYFNQNGVMQTGFSKVNGNTYYFDISGKMLYKWQTINKIKYYFGKLTVKTFFLKNHY